MGLIKLGLVGAAGYAIARKVNNKYNTTSNSDLPRQTDDRPSYRDTTSGYVHQGHCNGQCERMCNGQQRYGLHDWTCNGQCGGQCVTQRQARGPCNQVSGGATQGYYVAGGLGEREMLPSYESSRAAASTARAGDVKA